MLSTIHKHLYAACAFALVWGCAVGVANANNYQISNCSDSIPPQKGSFRYYLDIANSNPNSDIISFPPKDGTCVVTPVAPFVIEHPLWVQAGGPPAMRFRLITDSQLDDQTVVQVNAPNVTLDGFEMIGAPSQRGVFVNQGAWLNFRGGRLNGFKNPTSAADPDSISGGYGSGFGAGILALGNLGVAHSYVQYCEADYGAGIAFLPNDSLNSFSFFRSVAENNTASAEGGALFLVGPSGASNYYHITDANFYDNVSMADGGAVFAALGNTRMSNSTLTDNKAAWFGGGIYQYGGSLDVEFSTLVDNHSWRDYGHEIRAEDANVELDSNIIGYRNTWTGGAAFACYLSSNPQKSIYNVLQETSCKGAASGNIVVADMGLSGPSLYLPVSPGNGPPNVLLLLFGLQPNSAALDYGNPARCGTGSLSNDQRGFPRTGTCDAGAFEQGK